MGNTLMPRDQAVGEHPPSPSLGCPRRETDGWVLAISALVGVGVGLGAAALIYLVEWLEEFFLPFAIDQGHPWAFLTVPHRVSLRLVPRP